MRENYNSFSYWENVIRENRTIRGHMLMQEPPTEKSLYFHTLIFSKKNGINNMWGYFPNIKSLIGYFQYSFLQEAFYKWAYGKESIVTRIPITTVEKIAQDAEKRKIVTKEVANKMREDYKFLDKLWYMPSSKAKIELKKFIRDFNKKWMGDNKEFLYIKLFEKPEDVGEFVISSGLLTNTEEELENKIGMKLEEWKSICKSVLKDIEKANEFKRILVKKLSEVF